MMNEKRLRTTMPLLIGIVLLGFALRLYHINQVPLRGDEAFTVIHWMREPLSDTLANIATVDPQPPLAYLIYHIWGFLTGTGEQTVRLLPALLNLIGVPALYALGKRIGGRRVGLLAALLWAVHPYQIWHAQDARNYGIWAAASSVSLWLGLRAVEHDRRVDWALYVIAAAAAAYLYYLELFALVVINLYVLLTRWRDRRLLLRWLGAQVAIGLLLAPWYLQERLLVSSGYGGTAGGFELEKLWTWFIPTLTFGDALPASLAGWIWRPLLVALGAGMWVLWRRDRRHALLIGLLATLPLVLLSIVSTRMNVFAHRYVLAAAPAYVLLLTMLVVALLRSRAGGMIARASGALLLVAVLAIQLGSLTTYYFDYTKSPDWRALASYLSERSSPDDLIIQGAADEAYTFYADQYQIPAEGIRLPASERQPNDEIGAVLAERAPQGASIWRVAQTPPNWPNAGVVEDWLNSQMQLVRATQANGMRVEQYRTWQVVPDEIEAAPLATFGGLVELVGVRVFPPEPTGELVVWLYWRPIGQSAGPLKLFVHLTGPTNPATGTPLWSQDDQEPQDGRVTTDRWDIGTIYRDIYVLPLANVAPGTYQLSAGIYAPDTNQRIPTANGADHAVIGEITLP